MQFTDSFGTRLLVQTIDVLGHHRANLSLVLPPGQNPVGDVGFKVKWKRFLPIKPKEILRISLIKAVADDAFRGLFKLLGIETVYVPEIRYYRFRADPRTGKGHDTVAFRNPLLQVFQLFHGAASLK